MSASTPADDHAPPVVFDVDHATFATSVIARSHQLPVVVDFWAGWCGPCKTLGPMLEAAVQARSGEVLLAKVDVDANQELAQRYRVQGIPQVIGFRDGEVVGSFTGVVPADQIDTFLEALRPSEADQAVARARTRTGADAEAALREALACDPTHREAALALADHLVARDPHEALELARPHRPDPRAEAVVTRAELARDGGADAEALQDRIEALRDRIEAGDADGAVLLELGRALAAKEEHDEAIDRLLAAIEIGDDAREPAREQLVALFGVLGADDPRVTAARPRLARALF
jgi:putative thioredoxin